MDVQPRLTGFGFTRDSVVWWLGIITALATYLISDGRNPFTVWTYLDWVKFIAMLAATTSGKLAMSPLPLKEDKK